MSNPVGKYRAIINTLSEACIGTELGAITGGSTPGSGAWPAANTALFIPLYLEAFVHIKRLFIINGSTASGNLDLGIYAEDGTRIVSKGSTAQSGTNAIQFLDITDTTLGPGRYYLACAMDGTTGTVFRANLTVIRLQEFGVVEMTTAFALPATATFATVSAGLLPMIGAELLPGTAY